MTKPKDTAEDFHAFDCSSSYVSNQFYHTEFTTVPTPEQAEARRLAEANAMTTEEIEKELRDSGIDVDAFLKRCNDTVDKCFQKAMKNLEKDS